MSFSQELARWVESVGYEDLPEDVIAATKLRVMDVIGLALAGAETDFGKSVRNAALAMASPGPCRVWGTGDRAGVTAAAFANGSFPQAMEFDDTHIESIVHMSSPAVAAALALSELHSISGRDLITAVAMGNEISCRVGCVSSGELHRRGFHPTGLFAPFGVCYLASKLLGLDADATARAAGICGSFAAGLLECWVDGTQSKFLHSGCAAQSGIMAALLARAGTTGPAQVFEGRFGMFAAHVQDPQAHRDFARIDAGLGGHWESRNSSFKPFPAAHVIHPYISAVLRLREQYAIKPLDVVRVECPVAGFIVGIVCEPTSEKWAPSSDSHGRVSLQYSVAEALYCGALGKNAYAADSLRNPEILALACKGRIFRRSTVSRSRPLQGRGPDHARGWAHRGRNRRIQPRIGGKSHDRRGDPRQIRREREWGFDCARPRQTRQRNPAVGSNPRCETDRGFGCQVSRLSAPLAAPAA